MAVPAGSADSTWVLVLASAANLMVGLDALVVSTALTEIGRHLQEPFDQPIATGARITGKKQRLPGLDRGDASLREQRIRKFGRQDRGMDVGGHRLSHGYRHTPRQAGGTRAPPYPPRLRRTVGRAPRDDSAAVTVVTKTPFVGL